MGVAQEKTLDVDAAIQSYQRALENDPKLTEVSVKLSLVLLDRGAFKRALEVAEAGLEVSQENQLLWANKEQAQAGIEMQAKMLAKYKAKVAASPDNHSLRYGYAQLLAGSHEQDAAVEQLRLAIQSPDPGIAGAAADLLNQLGAFAECIAGLDTALKAKANPDLYVRRGICREGMKDDARALLDYQAALAADEKSAAGHYRLGLHYLTAGKKQEAKAHLTKAAELGAHTRVGLAAHLALAEIK